MLTGFFGLCAAIFALIFLGKKSDISDTIRERNKTDEEAAKLDAEIAANKAKLAEEEAKAGIQKEHPDVSKEDLVDFANNLKPSK